MEYNNNNCTIYYAKKMWMLLVGGASTLYIGRVLLLEPHIAALNRLALTC